VEVKGDGTKGKPWESKTPSGLSNFRAYRDEVVKPPALVVTLGTTTLQYQLRCLDDLETMLKTHGDWMPLGRAEEQKAVAPGTVEVWARSPQNPVGSGYGMKKGLRGRFDNYVPPVIETLGRRPSRRGTARRSTPRSPFVRSSPRRACR
jgi:hypothetical protein